jgi:hypothetical protein
VIHCVWFNFDTKDFDDDNEYGLWHGPFYGQFPGDTLKFVEDDE